MSTALRASLCAAIITLALPAGLAAQDDALSQRADRALTAWATLAQRLDVDTAAISIAALASEVGSRRPEAAWALVRDRIAFDPYEGSMRGARGTLFSAGGNALDTSLLLGAVYDELGVTWRLATCELTDEQAVELVRSAGGAGRYLGPAVPADAQVHDASRDVRHRNVSREHVFVQVYSGGEWADYDPTWPLATPGVGPCVAAETWETTPPDALIHHATISVHYATRGTDGGTSVTWDGALPDVAWRNITLELDRDDVDDSVVPELSLASETVAGTPIPLDGVTRVWVELFFRLGNVERRLVRDLYLDGSQSDRLHLDQQVYSIVLLPGFVGPDYHHAVVGALRADVDQALDSLVDGVEGLPVTEHIPADVADALDATLAALAGLTTLTFATRSDRIALELAATVGVRPFYASPRVVMTGAFRHGSQLLFELDLRDNDIDTVVFEGVPPAAANAFHATRGWTDTWLSGYVLTALTGADAPTVIDLLEAARTQGAGLRTVHLGNVDRVAGASWPAEARTRLESDVSDLGLVALAPSQTVDVDGVSITPWWRVEPGTGALLGVVEHDVHGTVGPVGAPERGEGGPQRAAEHAVTTVETFVAGLAQLVDASESGGDTVCAARCDLLELAPRVCSGDRAPDAFEECLRGRSASGGTDLLQLTASCTAVTEPMACGADLTDAVIGRYIELRASSDTFSGPWDDVEPLTSRTCLCD